MNDDVDVLMCWTLRVRCIGVRIIIEPRGRKNEASGERQRTTSLFEWLLAIADVSIDAHRFRQVFVHCESMSPNPKRISFLLYTANKIGLKFVSKD
ncbi:unnamed protein product [Heligmosomoides polygyrus]|uniref:Uncharacterized protein n=1 Tax=Heligmosomoides polygyrus TaxID=6339 RepID=A0A183FL36_HELPZ|nr:unnamed protein product [Heligmosomoides polygyrus]